MSRMRPTFSGDGKIVPGLLVLQNVGFCRFRIADVKSTRFLCEGVRCFIGKIALLSHVESLAPPPGVYRG
jgi:hypothetical protein